MLLLLGFIDSENAIDFFLEINMLPLFVNFFINLPLSSVIKCRRNFPKGTLCTGYAA